MRSSDARMLVMGALVTSVVGVLIAFAAASHRESAARLGRAPEPARAPDQAPAYADLRVQRRGPNADLYAAPVRALRDGLPHPAAARPPSDEERRAALAARAERRAYDGAPPTIPHAVTERLLDCSGCHAEGAVVGGVTAPMRSHGPLPSCVQCHVPGESPLPARGGGSLANNDFAGAFESGGGTVAWQGAPPTIPHSTHMRSECGSCHGAAGPVGLRTPHPHQVSCTQCHAPSAALDQRSGATTRTP